MKLTWKPLAAAAVAIVVLIGIIAAVAGKSGAQPKASISAAPPSESPAVLDTWKQAGLTVSAFTPADGKTVGGQCQSGTVGGVDVELCNFADASAAKKAEDRGLSIVGETTGVSIAQGSMLLIAADRRKADPSGRTINQIAKLFRGNSRS
ncbi:MAG TPA: hypothetical protein VL463_21100 [Kofleriaceae bacterium]|nr:hypothetical protein [Kofleriaceae bacterium]